MMTRAFARSASISRSTTANGSSSGVMKMRPMRLMTPTGSPVRVRAEVAAAARATPAGKFAGRSSFGCRGM